MTIYDMLKADIKILNRELKCADEILEILKKRLTKKECEVLNTEVSGKDKEVTMREQKIDAVRYEALKASAIKKMKNESVHGDFFYTKGE